MTRRALLLTVLISACAAAAWPAPQEGSPGPYSWYAADRGAKVSTLIPGRRLPVLTPDNLFADWTTQQVARWAKDHPAEDPEKAYERYAAATPTDAALTTDFPVHIAPLGRVHSGSPHRDKAALVMSKYCPFCGSKAYSLRYDPQNPYHATTSCCGTDLYGRVEDAPADYPLKPNTTAKFLHLDESWVEVPGTLYTDKDGVEWELFIKTIFDQRRWLTEGCSSVRQYANAFKETADPLYAHKIAVILDHVADTYYGLPLCHINKLAKGKDGKPLTRAEWEAVPRPAIFEVSYLGGWNRRSPTGSPGWINMSDEHIWVEPFARVRHHPAFKYYSQKKYGDPEALDRKIMTRLLRELSLMFKSVFSQKLLTNYQEANYVDLWLLGLLLQDEELTEFAGPAQEVTLYNHTYQDGLNGEGAPNYMAMPGGYFYPFLRDRKGWLQYYPDFLDDHPFYWAANDEMRKLHTVRGVQLEFGDQHEYAFPRNWTTDAEKVRANEQIGSRNWAGYGVGVLRVGGPGRRQEISLNYTRASLHNGHDALSLGCWVDGVPVMRRGGYAAGSLNVPLQWERPEFQALKQMDYPREIAEAGGGWSGWARNYVRSPLCQNNVTVDEVATGGGWGDNRGYGEVITFKGGEAAGEPGSGFQIIDVSDHYSWARMNKDVSDFRRTLIAVEGPNGRPYAIDILKVSGGQRHAFYQSAWADRGEDKLPAVKAEAEHLAEVFFGDELPEDNFHYRNFRLVRHVERLAEPGETWELTWKTDIGAYAPRDVGGKPFVRPLPEDVGRVRLRLIGIRQPGEPPELVRAQGPWIGIITQPLPKGHRVHGNVAFMDARDFLVEYRAADGPDQVCNSRFVHVLEGYREDEPSAIASVTPLEFTSLSGNERDIVALRLRMAGGHTDTVIYQSEAGTVRLPDGGETDARYALLRTNAAGEVIAAEACRGTYLNTGKFGVTMPGDLTGTIVDIIGDLTGTRQESALVIKPDKPWPVGENLKGRQLLVRVESTLRDACNEGYRVDKVTALPGGLVRVDMQDHATFGESWHQVVVLPPDKPHVLRTNRPMVAHGNAPWYAGTKAWFPERGKLYTIKNINRVGGGYGGDTLEVVGEANLSDDGIQVGDWYVIYAIEPGLKVTVANDFCFRQEETAEWKQYAVRAAGTVTVQAPAIAGIHSCRSAGGTWRETTGGRDTFSSEEMADGSVLLMTGKPDWLKLNDSAAPAVVRLTLDGKDVDPEAAADLGWMEPPHKVAVEFRDADNPLEMRALEVTLDGKRLEPREEGPLTSQAGKDGKDLSLQVNLEQALADSRYQARSHVLQVAISDRSVDRHQTTVILSYIAKVPLDPDGTYLSDLKAVKAFAHGGLILDRDYGGKVAEIVGRVYPKCVMICPEPSADGTHGEVIYELPGGKEPLTLKADIGIEEMTRGRGSAVFMVQRGDTLDGQWETLFSSSVLRGGGEPVSISVELGRPKYLRLYTTDAGDGINSDHALWGNARLY